MGIIGGPIGYQILRWIGKNGKGGHMDGSAYSGKSKVEKLLGPDIWVDIQGKTVIDFGCGEGAETIEMARRGARRVIGVDIQERFLDVARARAADSGVADRCIFTTRPSEPADVIIAIDSFEHFADPLSILRVMKSMLGSDGSVIAAFGPTWYHPYGGHLFSVFPWAHLMFTEKALIRWRSDFKNDGATCFSEVEGGLNQMTISRFERIVEQSPFKFVHMESVPIQKFRAVANHLTREFTTSIIRCKLVPRDETD